jgi:hypothetical protein
MASLILRYPSSGDGLSAADDDAAELGDEVGASDDVVAEDEDEEMSMPSWLEESSTDIVLVGEGVLHCFKSISFCPSSWATVGPVYLIANLIELEFCSTE